MAWPAASTPVSESSELAWSDSVSISVVDIEVEVPLACVLPRSVIVSLKAPRSWSWKVAVGLESRPASGPESRVGHFVGNRRDRLEAHEVGITGGLIL